MTMNSKRKERSRIEQLIGGLDIIPKINPGDQVLFEVAHSIGDMTRYLWGYVVSSRDSAVQVVVDMTIILNKTCRIRDGDIVTVKTEKVVGHIPRPDGASIYLSTMNGVITEMRRVDGKSGELKVVVDEDDDEKSTVFKVTGSGFTI